MHTSSTVVLVVAVALASMVEMVEALTIVVAAGVSRGWRSALEGAAAAVVVLGIIVAAVGPALIHFVPLRALRVVVGALLLILGLQWLRKAILRAAGLKEKHDEDRIFAEQVRQLEAVEARTTSTRDAVGFTVAFKGVFLEGVEVVLIVLTLGAADNRIGLAALAAGGAFVVVAIVGVIVARQLSRVPENTMKTVVGVMLVSFGSFWAGEGIGVKWFGSDLGILALVGLYACTTLSMMAVLRRRAAPAEQVELHADAA